MNYLFVTALLSCIYASSSKEFNSYGTDRDQYIADSLFQALVDTMGKDYATKYEEVGHLIDPDILDVDGIRAHLASVKYLQDDDDANYHEMVAEDDIPYSQNCEYSQSHPMCGRKYGFGATGEGKEKFYSMESTILNKNVIKTDSLLPAYCNPPNPCPVGYTAKDGCIEDFENTAEFSRAYQAAQQCMCDTEHMFNCPQASFDGEGDERINEKNALKKKGQNPYLEGEMLPVAAKKGFSVTA